MSIANSRGRPSPPEGEATDSEYGSPFMSPEGREMAIPRMKVKWYYESAGG